VLIGTDDAPRLRIDLYCGLCLGLDVRVLDTVVIVGCEDALAIVPFAEAPARYQPVGMYFGYFYDCDGYILALAGGDVTRIDRDGSIAWQSEHLSCDGIIIDRIEHGVIHGRGEWDRWRPFAISATTGAKIGD
jgi:hypothetical protein